MAEEIRNMTPLEFIKRPAAYARGYENIPTEAQNHGKSFVGNTTVRRQMSRTDAELYCRNC